MEELRTFETGATRGSDEEKLDFEGFLSPLVLQRFGEFMHKHRKQVDGKLRASDNWQKGIPQDAYMKSGFRHFMEWWRGHRGELSVDKEEALCALFFNVQGYLHELLRSKKDEKSSPGLPDDYCVVLPDYRPDFTDALGRT